MSGSDLAGLAACPFCGKASEFDPPAVYSGAPVFTVRCCIADTGMCFSKEAAIKKWNRRALAARLPGDGWLPIESAPRDGTWVLACSIGGASWQARYRSDRDRPYGKAGWTRHNSDDIGWEPHLWQPLPQSPTASPAAGIGEKL